KTVVPAQPDVRHDDVRGGRGEEGPPPVLQTPGGARPPTRARGGAAGDDQRHAPAAGEALPQGTQHHRLVVDHQDSGGHEQGLYRRSQPVGGRTCAGRPKFVYEVTRFQLKGPNAFDPAGAFVPGLMVRRTHSNGSVLPCTTTRWKFETS